MAPVERPGRATVDVAVATAVEDSEMGTETVAEDPDGEGVLRATVTLVEDRVIGAATGAAGTAVAGPVETGSGAPVPAGLAAEDVPLSPIAGEPRTPIRSVAMKSPFTLREYTKSKTALFIRVNLSFENYSNESLSKITLKNKP